ncbi:MAG: hypothetical protein NVS2B16_04460 [Chloroflexota bacterium]
MPIGVRYLHMLDSSTGWALTDRGVARTTDGGHLWVDVTPSGMARTRAAIFSRSAAFYDRQHAWIAQGVPPRKDTDPPQLVVLRTINGGRTWRRSNKLLGQVYAFTGNLDFLNPRTGWLFSVLGAGAGQAAYMLYHSVDGGATWHALMHAGDGNPSPASIPGCDCYNGVSFRDARGGWISGVNGFARGAGAFYRTRDGGRRWKPQSLRVPAHYASDYVETDPPRFFSRNIGTLPVILYKPRALALYTTRDGGMNWYSATPLRIGIGSPVYSMPDANHAWVVAGTALYRTTDGGRVWQRIQRRLPSPPPMQVDFVTRNIGFVVVGREGESRTPRFILKTLDAGKSFATVATLSQCDDLFCRCLCERVRESVPPQNHDRRHFLGLALLPKEHVLSSVCHRMPNGLTLLSGRRQWTGARHFASHS